MSLSSCLGVTLATVPQAGTHGLQILNAQKEDTGQYTCVVTNELGEAVKNYHVEVLSASGGLRGLAGRAGGGWVPRATPVLASFCHSCSQRLHSLRPGSPRRAPRGHPRNSPASDLPCPITKVRVPERTAPGAAWSPRPCSLLSGGPPFPGTALCATGWVRVLGSPSPGLLLRPPCGFQSPLPSPKTTPPGRSV